MTASITSAPIPAPVPGSLWSILADELDIAPSLYQEASERHRSLGRWFCRPASSLARFSPDVRPQGSFRFGTVIKPLPGRDTAYDLDQVVVLETLRPQDVSQAELKAMFGHELAAYARAHGMEAPEEKHRCWCLNYSDEVSFQLDSLPCVPAIGETVLTLRGRGVSPDLAERAVAITDDRHPSYYMVRPDWLTSNPRGFARWFEARAALGRQQAAARGVKASVEDVPAYEWRTPLQRAVQLLKRHRDVMFRDQAELAPISMIITNLAAHAYRGERDLGEALTGIVERMGDYVRPVWPRVPNPTHPDEDYADKWRIKPALERSFNVWLEQVRADVRILSGARLSTKLVEQRFAIGLTEEQERRLGVPPTSQRGAPALILSGPAQRIETAPRPWARYPDRGQTGA